MKGNPVLHNAAWIIGCRVIQSVLQLVVGMLCARYLGPATIPGRTGRSWVRL